VLDRPARPDQRRAKEGNPRSRRAAWQRAYRRRQAAGRMCVSIEVDHRVIDWLCATQWLVPHGEVVTRAEIASAIERMIQDAARG
jgi:hypothetical protein